MQCVPGKIGRNLHIELRVAVAHVAAQQIGAAADIEPQTLARLQNNRLRRQTEAQRDRNARRQRLGVSMSSAISVVVERAASIRQQAGRIEPIDRIS